MLLKSLSEFSDVNDNERIYAFFIEITHFLAELCYEGYSMAIRIDRGSQKLLSLPVNIKIMMAIIELLNSCNEGGNSFLNISQKKIQLDTITKWLIICLPIPVKLPC